MQVRTDGLQEAPDAARGKNAANSADSSPFFAAFYAVLDLS